MWRNICAVFFMSAGLLVGCGKGSDDTSGPAVSDKPALPDGVKPRPTTQELQDRVKLDLKYDPISIMAPSSWELKSIGDGSMVVVEGYTPHDKVSISLPVARAITNDRNVPASVKIKSLETQAKADAAKHPELVKGEIVRDISGAHVIEDMTLDDPVVASTQEIAAGTAQTIQPMHWVITVCVPSGQDFKAYELRFQGLTVATYQQEGEFLRSIIGSISCNAPPTDSLVK